MDLQLFAINLLLFGSTYRIKWGGQLHVHVKNLTFINTSSKKRSRKFLEV